MILPLLPALALAAGAGVVTRLAFPAPGWWPLAIVGVAMWVVSCAGRTRRGGALVGLGYGAAFFAPLLHWSGIYVGSFPWIVLSGLEAAYLALLGALVPAVLRLRPAIGAVGVAALWVGQEALRARTPYGGFPWGRLAFSQVDGPLAPLAALGGAPLVSFAVALAGALLGVAVLQLVRRPSGQRRSGARTAVLAAAGAVLVTGSGLLVALPTSGPTVQVAGVQGNVPEPGLDFNSERRAVLDNHTALTRRLAGDVASGRAPAPQVVIWPENASDLDPYRAADARAAIDGAVDAVGVPTLVGAVLQRDDGRLTNASIVWDPRSGPGARYAKRHPVPFGEYIPNRAFFRRLSSQVDLVNRDFAAGTAVGRLDLGPTRLGVAICFEVAYDDLVRDTVRDGADLLVVQTNNATFGYTDEAVQQLAMSRLRAIEHGRAVAHVSTVGVSALIAPDGRVITSSGLFVPAVLQAALPLRTQLTVSDRVGGWPEAVLVAVGLVFAAASARPGRRRRSTTLGDQPVRPTGTLTTTEAR